jgi:Dyp-type peroxidase family
VVVLERRDIQGVVVSGYGHLPRSAYLLFRIEDQAAARAWLGAMAEEVTDAAGKRAECSVNVALTYDGLAALGLDDDALRTFPLPFTDRMDSPRRATILGDSGESAPAGWDWGNAANRVHVLLMVFGPDEAELETVVTRFTDGIAAAGAMSLVANLPGHRLPGGKEHFGFRDGIGQPIIEGNERRAEKQLARTGHVTVVKAGEFVLGYPNEYGLPPVSPVVAAARDPLGLLPEYDVPDDLRFSSHTGPLRDLGRNGSYLVFRQLRQDVAGFWAFLDDATRGATGGPDRAAQERLGAKFVGRWPSGAPLVLAPDQDDPSLATANDFSYAALDSHGFACPLGSHVRRANPRDALRDDAAESVRSVRRHRIVRLGRFYGDVPADPRHADDTDRGIYFLCLNADIERQFEFVQQTWLNDTVFRGLDSETDPLVGDQDDSLCARTMTIQADPLRRKVTNLQRFVTTRGGSYFFLPGLNALRYLGALA